VGSNVEGFHQRQLALMERMASGAPMYDVLDGIVRLIEEESGGMLCSVLLLDSSAGVVRHGAAPHLPAEYVRALDGSAIGPEAGSCGRAAYLGERVVTEDIAEHPHWAGYRHLALPYGLRACWSSPIFSRSDEVLGTFAMYYLEPRGPLPEEVRLVAAATHLASIAISHERTQRALAASELRSRRGEQRLLALIENTPNVSIQWFDRQGRILYCNKASEKMFAMAAEQVKGKQLEELNFAPEEAARFRAALETVATTGSCVGPMEFEFRRPDGTLGALLSTVFELPVAEGERCFVCMDVDLTESKRLEQERLRLSQQLEHAQRLQALGTLSGGIAHDFNNVLAAITGNVELGLAEFGEPEAVHASLVEIQKAAGRATDLVRQILSFSRREAPARDVIDPRLVIEEVAGLLRATFPAGVTLQLALAEDTPKIWADGSQLHQVLMNLGTNAMLALADFRGIVRISSERVSLSREDTRPPRLEPGCYALIRVSDTGCGMDEATLARIFEPFFTTRTPGRGTGLGLSVVHGIMQHHEGAIGVQSRVGVGTTFSLHFAAAASHEVRAVSERTRPAAGHGKHILYVDDEDALVALASRSLSRTGYRVTPHSDSLRALLDFRSRCADFDAVVTDFSMPGLSGPDLVRELRRVRPDIPIVVLSGFMRAEDVECMRGLDVLDIMPKPHPIEELARTLERRLNLSAAPGR
jgi:two-component system cell cycle sensor histidine kinase/response regulator CckA